MAARQGRPGGCLPVPISFRFSGTSPNGLAGAGPARAATCPAQSSAFLRSGALLSFLCGHGMPCEPPSQTRSCFRCLRSLMRSDLPSPELVAELLGPAEGAQFEAWLKATALAGADRAHAPGRSSLSGQDDQVRCVVVREVARGGGGRRQGPGAGALLPQRAGRPGALRGGEGGGAWWWRAPTGARRRGAPPSAGRTTRCVAWW